MLDLGSDVAVKTGARTLDPEELRKIDAYWRERLPSAGYPADRSRG